MFPLWPDNVQAFSLFLAMRQQWRHGSMGPTGLDAAGVEAVLRNRPLGQRIPRRRIPQLLDDILTVAEGALRGWSEIRPQQG